MIHRHMHLQQTKAGSRATGGPQYYLQGLSRHLKEFLQKRGSCPVLLQTPYGIARSSFIAVEAYHKISASGKTILGKVGHDRIQGEESIGEAIRYWYGLKGQGDFKSIEVEAGIHPDGGHIVLTPTAVTMRGGKRAHILEKASLPLSFHRDHQSKLWKKQIEELRKSPAGNVAWAGAQIRRVVAEHQNATARNVHEADLLRVAGALSVLGLDLSLYLTKGYDCPESRFHFLNLPSYPCPVEIKKSSKRFDYQIMHYTELPRAVVVCLNHDLVNPPEHVDVVELSTLGDYLGS
jgi:hypothetical protein